MSESRPLLATSASPEFESVWSDLQGVPFSQGFLDAGGVRTRYLHAGDPSKPVLVFLHGSGGHAEAYVRNLESHAEHFSTWSIDMLGHGYTSTQSAPSGRTSAVSRSAAGLRHAPRPTTWTASTDWC